MPTSPIREVVELAEERFGQRSALKQPTVIALAETYALDYGLTDFGTHAETTTLCVVLAACRTNQMQLLFEIQVDIERVMEATDVDYGEAVFKLSQGGGHKKVWKEIDVLEDRAAQYRALIKARVAQVLMAAATDS